jgi:hypothetical protein
MNRPDRSRKKRANVAENYALASRREPTRVRFRTAADALGVLRKAKYRGRRSSEQAGHARSRRCRGSRHSDALSRFDEALEPGGLRPHNGTLEPRSE